MPDTANDTKKTLWDIALKALFVIVPLMGAWIVKLEVTNATQTLQIEQLQVDLAAAKAPAKDIVEIKIALGSLDTKVTSTSEKVDKLYDRLLQ